MNYSDSFGSSEFGWRGTSVELRERETPGKEVLGSISAVAARSQLVGMVSL